MSIAEGLADVLVRASTEKSAVIVRADCFIREGFPIGTGQEYCRLKFSSVGRGKNPRYGLLFIMDWTKALAVAGSVECF
jgi:hypothetical protein